MEALDDSNNPNTQNCINICAPAENKINIAFSIVALAREERRQKFEQ